MIVKHPWHHPAKIPQSQLYILAKTGLLREYEMLTGWGPETPVITGMYLQVKTLYSWLKMF